MIGELSATRGSDEVCTDVGKASAFVVERRVGLSTSCSVNGAVLEKKEDIFVG